MGVIIVAALLFVSYSCTCRLGLSQSDLGPTLNAITSNDVIVLAGGVNSLHVAWWISESTVVMRYTVSCSALRDRANMQIEQIVKHFTDNAINSLSVNDLAPQTTYNCCVIAEYGIDNSYSACKKATTSSIASDCQQGNSSSSSSLNPIVGAAISLFVMLLITLLCTSVLFMIAMRQWQDRKKIKIWLRTVKDQYHLESDSHDNHYANIKGSEHSEPDAVICTTFEHNEADDLYCTAADAVEQDLPSDHSIETIDCVAYGTSEPVESNESDIRNSEIYEAIT